MSIFDMTSHLKRFSVLLSPNKLVGTVKREKTKIQKLCGDCNKAGICQDVASSLRAGCRYWIPLLQLWKDKVCRNAFFG